MQVADKISKLTPQLFLDGPSQFLAKNLALQFIKERHWVQIFGTSVESYDREDFSIRELPALRFYLSPYTKEHESHYMIGEIHADIILPPLLRRNETNDIPSQIAAAFVQQFRRPNFFAAMQLVVPGLNELGKVVTVDQSLVFQNTEMNDECPVTHITLNFRIDLKQWDAYLEKTGRTKDDPFDVTLANLVTITTDIQGTLPDGSVGVTIGLGGLSSTQKV